MQEPLVNRIREDTAEKSLPEQAVACTEWDRRKPEAVRVLQGDE